MGYHIVANMNIISSECNEICMHKSTKRICKDLLLKYIYISLTYCQPIIINGSFRDNCLTPETKHFTLHQNKLQRLPKGGIITPTPLKFSQHQTL